ncbi:MAG: SusC/RagA family TonB-linked outer membrane protein [Saprospiraceae bacterium]|nr:SusC/RagA family TonB-linked outer membrane protein [Lewinella sp.]
MKLKVDYFSKWLLVVLAVCLTNLAFSQRTISGSVTDSQSGEPLIGANILVVGTSSGTITDFDGNYTLEIPADASELDVSYTGYGSERVAIPTGTDVLNMTLTPGEMLEEIVVVGYGTQKSKEVTSAITSIKEEDFNSGNLNNPTQLLQGKVAGLTISRPGGDPNAGVNIRLRGLSTLGANTQPLVIIDGVLGADLNSVDPNDIASIDVLKDASAAAIYGTRGGSGVILITTKTGEAGVTRVNYEGYVTAESVDRYTETLSADQFRSFAGGPNSDIRGTDLGSSTDWFDEITETGFTQVHSLSLSGGSKGTSYRVSGNYRNVNGIALNTGFNRINGRVNLQQKALNDRLKIDASYTTTSTNQDFGFNDAFRYASIYNPTAPVRSTDAAYDKYDGYFQQVLFDYYNPVAILEQNTNQGETRNSIASLRGTYTLVEGLDFSLFYSQERNDFQGRQYWDKNSFFTGQDRNGLASQRDDKSKIDLFEATATYNLNFGSTDLRLLGGYSYQDFLYSGFGATGGDIISDAFGYNNLGAAQDFNNGVGDVFSYKNSNRIVAFFGRANLNIDDTYFFSASLRREGSSQFGANNKWGTFPGISAGVNLVNALALSGFDNLKLRVGYGETGNRPPGSYISLQRFGPGASFFYNGAYVPSYGPVSNPNPDLKWEVKKDLDVGVDFAFGDFKVTGSVDYFSTSTKDLIYEIGVPVPPNLYGSTQLNIGEINNSGLEAVVNIRAVENGNFSWNTSLNGTYYLASELKEFLEEANGSRDLATLGSPGQSDVPLVRVQEGAPLGQLWGIVFEGVSPEGNWIYSDINGDGNPGQNDDRTVIGNGLPDFQLGWNNTFTFGNLDFNFFLRGTFGHDLINTYRAFYEAPQAITSYNLPVGVYDIQNLGEAPKFSSYHVEDASFIKLDNATLGYTFDVDGTAFNKIRAYLNTNNLFTITGYSGVDPEVRLADGDNALAPGIDRRNTYFTTRSFTFGVQLGF